MKQKKITQEKALLRLLTYLFNYKLKFFIGLTLLLLTTLSNLVTLGSLTPIFNLIGVENKITLFPISSDEELLLSKHQFETSENTILNSFQLKMIILKKRVNIFLEKYSNKEVILLITSLIVPLYFLKLIFLTLSIYFLGTASLATIKDIRKAVYEKLLKVNLFYLHKEKTGALMSKVINDTEAISKILSMQLNDTLIDFFYIITHLGFLFWISWKMTIILFLLIPFMGLPINKIARQIRKTSSEQQKRLSDIMAHLQEFISGIRVIRIFGIEKLELKKFHTINQRLYKNTFLTHYYHQISPLVSEFLITFLILSFLIWGSYEMTHNQLSRGLFLTFFFLAFFIAKPLKRISITVNSLMTLSSLASRVFEVFHENDSVNNNNYVTSKSLLSFKKSIEFNNVVFSYPESPKPILDHISFKVNYGEKIAIVGHSGSGKSTLIDLLMRLYAPQEGQILLDDTDVQNISLEHLRKQISVVSQDVFLFHASISENIAWSLKNETIDKKKIEKVAKNAKAHNFIMNLEMGYDTIVGERGVMLSGGERQRIAIARTLFLNPPILILDEATSSLDNESEALIQQEFEKLSEGRTVIIIAHRLSSIQNCNRILVMDKGQIIEEGTNETLLEKKGAYYNLYTRQIKI